MENIEEIVLNKLGAKKRSAFNILNNKELCDRIVNENPVWLDNFSKEYNISKSILQRLIKINTISSFSNFKGKGSKVFIFKDEALNVFKLDYNNAHIFTSIKHIIELYLLHVKNTITTREYEVLNDTLINNLSYVDIGKKYDLTRERVRQIFEKANRRIKNSYRINIEYDKLKSEYETLNFEVKLLKEKRINLGKSKIFLNKDVIKTLPLYTSLKKEIWDLDMSVRLLNSLRNLKIETLGDVVIHDVSYFTKCRNMGVKSLNELELILKEHKLQFGMLIPKID